MKKRRARRPLQTASYGQLFGVELFEDSRLLRMVRCQVHYNAVDEPGTEPPFPLADVEDPTMTNANISLYLLRQHAADDQVLLVHQHRYFHRDSHDPSDGLDLKRTHIHSASADEGKVQAMVLDFCHLATTMPLCAPVEVYDFSSAPIDVAFKALTKLPFVHTRVVAPDGGVQ